MAGSLMTEAPMIGGARPGAGKPLDPVVDKWRQWMRARLWRDREKHYTIAIRTAAEGTPHLLHQLYNKALPNPVEPQAGPPAMPPFVLVIGQNGGNLALGYAPQGVVPGMEAFMPKEVRALAAGPANGRKNGKGKR